MAGLHHYKTGKWDRMQYFPAGDEAEKKKRREITQEMMR